MIPPPKEEHLMDIYLAHKDTHTLMEGTFEEVLGVFDSVEKAWAFLATTRDFERSKQTKDGRVYHFDGELSYYWHVRGATLNKPIKEG
jgi:hypothetical protein